MYKNFFENKKAVIFDLDGTIFKEAEEFRKQAIEKALWDLNYSYIDPRPQCINGYSLEEIWKAITQLNEIKDVTISDLVTKTRESYLEIIKNSDISPTEGFWDIFYELKQDKNFKTAMATNTPRSVQETVMEKLDIKNIFDATVFGDDVKKHKPHPDIYNKTLKLLKVKPKDAIVFEDSIPGAKAAKKAGIDVLIIWDETTRKAFFENNVLFFTRDFTPYPGSLDETHGEYLVRSYKEFVEKE